VARYSRQLPQAKKLEVPPSGGVNPLRGGRRRKYPLADVAPNGAYVSPKGRHRLSALKYAQRIWGRLPKEFSSMRIRNTRRFNVSPAIFKRKASTLSRKEKVISFVVRFSLLIEKCGSKLRLGPSPIINLRRACSLLRTVLPPALAQGLWPSRWGRAHKHEMPVQIKLESPRKEVLPEIREMGGIWDTPREIYSSQTHNRWVHHEEKTSSNRPVPKDLGNHTQVISDDEIEWVSDDSPPLIKRTCSHGYGEWTPEVERDRHRHVCPELHHLMMSLGYPEKFVVRLWGDESSPPPLSEEKDPDTGFSATRTSRINLLLGSETCPHGYGIDSRKGDRYKHARVCDQYQDVLMAKGINPWKWE